MGYADDLQAAFIIDKNQELHVPGKHPRERVPARMSPRWRARATDRKAAYRCAPSCVPLKLHAGARNVAGGAEVIRIVACYPLDPATERRIKHCGDHTFLAVLGEQGQPASGIDMKTASGSWLNCSQKLYHLVIHRYPEHDVEREGECQRHAKVESRICLRNGNTDYRRHHDIGGARREHREHQRIPR